MNALPVYRPPNPPARRAGLALLVLGGLALLFGVGLISAGFNLETLSQDPAVRERIDEIRRQIPVDPKILFVTYGVFLGFYAVAAVTLGLLVRGGRRVALFVTIALAALVATFGAFSVVVSVISGAIAPALLPAAVVAAHAMIVRWSIEALGRANATRPASALRPPVHQPMAAYYLPPVPPQARV